MKRVSRKQRRMKEVSRKLVFLLKTSYPVNKPTFWEHHLI